MARTSTSNGHSRSETRRNAGPKTLAEKVGLPSAGQPEGPWDHGETRPDGRPWWRHSLFPLELTAPDTVARWFLLDQKCEAKGGESHPEVLEVAVWSDDFGNWLELPGRISLTQIDREKFIESYEPGRYQLTAYTHVVKGDGDGRDRIATRTRTFANNGADEEEDDEIEEEDDDDQEDDETPRSRKGKSPGELELERERLRLAAEKEERQERYAREDRERAERKRLDGEERKAREDRERDDRRREREHQQELEKIRAGAGGSGARGAGGILGQLKELAELKAIAGTLFGEGKGKGGGEALGIKLATRAVEGVENIIIEIGGPIAAVWAKEKGVDVASLFPKTEEPAAGEEEEEEEEGGDEG